MRRRAKKNNMYYVYIIQSQKDKSHYTGITRDLKQRINQHNWHNVKTTKSKAPYKLVWYCCFLNQEKAFNFEKYLKTGSGIAFSRKRFV